MAFEHLHKASITPIAQMDTMKAMLWLPTFDSQMSWEGKRLSKKPSLNEMHNRGYCEPTEAPGIHKTSKQKEVEWRSLN